MNNFKLNNINKSEMITKVLINVLFISIFIGFFFFTYGAYIEKKVVKKQMGYLSTNFMETIKLLGKNVNEIASDNVNSITIPDLSHEDEEANENNKKVMKQVIKVNIIFILFVSFIVYYIYKNSNGTYDLKEIIKENLVILVFIGLIEFVFLTFFISRYISIDPNKAKLVILQSLKENSYI